MVAQTRQQHIRDFLTTFTLDLVLVHGRTKRALRRLVFNSATYGTGLTADTTPQVDKHGVTVSGRAFMPLRRKRKFRFSQRNQRSASGQDAELLEKLPFTAVHIDSRPHCQQ